MRIIYNEDLNKRIIPYVDKLIKNKKSWIKKRLFSSMYSFNILTWIPVTGRMASNWSLVSPKSSERKVSGMSPILFDGKLNKLLLYLLGDEYAGLFHTYLKIKARCPYTCGYSRRSQRSVDPTLHLNHVTDALTQFLKLRATGFNEQAILNGGRTPEEIETIKDAMSCQSWMAAQIAEGNATVIEYLQNVLTSENNANRLNQGHLQAIAASGYRPLLELEGKLLLAAKLQEGLRQAIVETMDEGCPESYLYLFSIIYDNGLQRFASVKRGIAVSTGIGEQDSSDRITNKYVELIRHFLNNQEDAREALQSKDTTKLYLALWSIGFYNTEDIQALIPQIIKEGAKYQVETLLYFLRCTQYTGMNHCISKEAWKYGTTNLRWLHPFFLSI